MPPLEFPGMLLDAVGPGAVISISISSALDPPLSWALTGLLYCRMWGGRMNIIEESVKPVVWCIWPRILNSGGMIRGIHFGLNEPGSSSLRSKTNQRECIRGKPEPVLQNPNELPGRFSWTRMGLARGCGVPILARALVIDLDVEGNGRGRARDRRTLDHLSLSPLYIESSSSS